MHSYTPHTNTSRTVVFVALLLGFLTFSGSVAEATNGHDWDSQRPTCTLTASRENVEYNGSVVLTWSSTDTIWASLTEAGSVPSSGTKVFSNLTNDRTYTLTVYGNNGKSATCSKTVYVDEQVVETPTCWLNANPSNVSSGNSTTLSWGSSHAQSASISDVGSVFTSGSRSVYPGYSRTYTMTVYGANGQSSTCNTYVSVDQYASAPSCSITLSNYTYDNYGGYYNRPATLSWTSTGNANTAYISSIGAVALSSSQTVYPSHNQVYTMTVSGPGGTNTCQTSYYQPQQNLSCTLRNSPDIVTPGGSAVLSWTIQGGTGNIRSATLSDIGSVSTNNSSTVVYPGISRTYTLTIQDVYGYTNTCSTYIAVGSGLTTNPNLWVTLNQVPYTGFDLGPVGTAFYFLTLSALSVGAAYLLFFWKGGVMAYAGLNRSSKATILEERIVSAHDSEDDEDETDGNGDIPARRQPVVVSEPIAREHAQLQDSMNLVIDGNSTPRIVINRTNTNLRTLPGQE